MTQPIQYIERINDNAEYTPPFAWRESSRVVQGFTADQEFKRRLRETGLNPTDTTTLEYADTLTYYCEDYCRINQLDGRLDQSPADQITLLANASKYIHNQSDLAYYSRLQNNHRLTIQEQQYHQSLKRYAVWYDQLLAKYAFSNPSDSMSDLSDALIGQAANNLQCDKAAVAEVIQTSTRGARTEAVARNLFDLAGIKYEMGTLNEDLRGGDFIVLYKNHRVKVDIKSTITKIAEIRGGYTEITQDGVDYAIKNLDRNHGRKKDSVIVLYIGFPSSELGDSLGMQLSPEAAQQHAESLAAQLRRALEELWPNH